MVKYCFVHNINLLEDGSRSLEMWLAIRKHRIENVGNNFQAPKGEIKPKKRFKNLHATAFLLWKIHSIGGVY